MSLRRFLTRNREEIGETLSIHRAGVNHRSILGMLLIWGTCTLLFLLKPSIPLQGVAIASVLTAVLCAVLLAWLSRESLVVCEKTLVVGNPVSFSPLFVIEYGRIDPGSLVPVTRAHHYIALTRPPGPSTPLRAIMGTRQGIHFVGPDPTEAKRPRSARDSLRSTSVRSITGNTIWYAGSGATPPAEVTARIAQAARRQGLTALAEAAAAAQPRALTRNPADRHILLPGYPRYVRGRSG